MMMVTYNGRAGLGNRIKTYVSWMSRGYRVATIKSADARIFLDIEFATDEVLLNSTHVSGWRLLVDEDESELTESYEAIDFLYEKVPDYFIHKYRKAFSLLKMDPAIEERVRSFSIDWQDMVGVHVRSWNENRERASWHSNDLYETAIEGLGRDVRLFFCSDNMDVQNHFERRFGDRLVTYPKRAQLTESGQTDDLLTTSEALIEMLLLAKCSTIIGTYISTFTECAWWFGDCRANAIIPKPPSVPRMVHDPIFLRKQL